MTNNGAIFTDDSGNIPEIKNILHCVDDLTVRLQKNRETVDSINKLAKRVLEQQTLALEELHRFLPSPQDDIKSRHKELARTNDDRLARESSKNSARQRQMRELERRSVKTQALPQQTSSQPESLPASPQTPKEKSQENLNLDLRFELQRLQIVEEKMQEVVQRYQLTVSGIIDGTRSYVGEYEGMVKNTIDTYESQLKYEKESQTKILAVRATLLKELENLREMAKLSSKEISNSLHAKLNYESTGQTKVTFKTKVPLGS